MPGWLQEPRGAAGFAGLCTNLGNLEALAGFEMLFAKCIVEM